MAYTVKVQVIDATGKESFSEEFDTETPGDVSESGDMAIGLTSVAKVIWQRVIDLSKKAK